ncbi:MAG: hypothetical protein RL662_427 [Bacteroidota bacterium]|jgi:DNA-directed RNA polymerase specialized sigma24 family protein
MRLGNTGGKNKGKKYLKITGNETITAQNSAMANAFAQWFGDNHRKLKTELIHKGTHNDDIVSETFLRIHDKILYGGLDVLEYKAYFHRAYFTNYIQDCMKQSKQAQLFVNDEMATQSIDNYLEMTEAVLQQQQLIADTIRFIKQRFAPDAYNMFVVYLESDTKQYCSVAEKLGLATEDVSQTIGRIKRIVKTNQKLTSARKSM